MAAGQEIPEKGGDAIDAAWPLHFFCGTGDLI